jgi:hypothetical protein
VFLAPDHHEWVDKGLAPLHPARASRAIPGHTQDWCNNLFPDGILLEAGVIERCKVEVFEHYPAY